MMSGSNRADPRELGLPIAHGSTFSAMLSPGREEEAERLPQALVNCLWSDSTSASLRKLHVSEGRTHQPNVTHHPNGFALRRKKISLCSGAVRRRSGPMPPRSVRTAPEHPGRHCSGSVRGLRSHGAVREPPSHCSRGQCFLLGHLRMVCYAVCGSTFLHVLK